MDRRQIYVRPEAQAVYARAQEIAAEHGRSLSDVVTALLALYVRVVDYGPTAPAGVDVYRAAAARAGAAFADLEAHPGDCDRCAGPGGQVRITFDLTVPGAPMTIARYSAGCSAQVPA